MRPQLPRLSHAAKARIRTPEYAARTHRCTRKGRCGQSSVIAWWTPPVKRHPQRRSGEHGRRRPVAATVLVAACLAGHHCHGRRPRDVLSLDLETDTLYDAEKR